MATSDKLQLLMNTKKNFKNVLNSHKENSITEETPFSEYPAVTEELLSNIIPTPSDDWQPQPDWWDIEAILENDTEDYEQKAIMLLRDGLDDSVNEISGFEKYVLSDGQVIEATIDEKIDLSNKFDSSKDKACSKGYKTRYVICYSNSNIYANIITPKSLIYIILNVLRVNNNIFLRDKYYLECVKSNNDKILLTSSFFQNCFSLEKIEGLDNIASSVNFLSTFSSCVLLKRVPNIDLTSKTSISGLLSNCTNLKNIKNVVLNPNVLNIASAFYNMKQIEEILCDFSSGNLNTITMAFSGCNKLRKIGKLNLLNVIVQTSANNAFSDCYSLEEIEEITNISVQLNFASSTLLTHSTLLKILNGLVDLTGQDAKTLTLGTTNLAKLTDEEKAIATDKNWILK